MSNFNDFQKMIKNLNDENLSELCEEFLTNHEAAMNILFKYCSEFGLTFDTQEIKDNMTIMHNNGDFDNIICFGIELSENQLYKKFHPSWKVFIDVSDYMHWRNLFMRIVEKPINKAAGLAKLAMIVASLTPYMVKLRKFLRRGDRISPTVLRSILITLLNTPSNYI